MQVANIRKENYKIDKNSLVYTKGNCKCLIVFVPKYRRQIIYGKIKRDVGKILRMLCERKGIEIMEAQTCSDTSTCC